MPCSCGVSKCNCLEICSCAAHFCFCTSSPDLSEVLEEKSNETNVRIESSPDNTRLSQKSEITNHDHNSGSDEEFLIVSSCEESENDVIFIGSKNTNLETGMRNSSSAFCAEIFLSDNECELIPKQQDCSNVKMEDNFDKIKPTNISFQNSTSRRDDVPYSLNKDTKLRRNRCRKSRNNRNSVQNSYQGFSRNANISKSRNNRNSIQNSYQGFSRNANVSKSRKRALMNQYGNAAQQDDNSTQVDEQTSSRLPCSESRRNSSQYEIGTHGLLSQNEDLTQYNGRKTWNDSISAPSDNQLFSGDASCSQFEELPPAFGQQFDVTLPRARKGTSIKSSILGRNRQKKTPDLSVYDFDVNEIARNSSNSTRLNFCNSSVRNYNLANYEINVYPSVSQRSCSGEYSNIIFDQSVSGTSNNDMTRNNESVSLTDAFLNASENRYFKANNGECNRIRKRWRRNKKGLTKIGEAHPNNELKVDITAPRKRRRRGRNRRKNACKQEGGAIKKEKMYIKREIKKEKGSIKKETSFVKKIKKEKGSVKKEMSFVKEIKKEKP